MSLFGSILGAVAGPIANKLFNKPKPQTNTVDYARLVKDAQAAGFNPLTALRNGGSAGFTVTNPALSSNSFIADALSQGFNAALGYKQDEMDKEREKIQIDLMKEELAQMKRRGKLYSQGNYGFGAPSATVYTGQHENVRPSAPVLSRPASSGGDNVDGYGNPVTNYTIAGENVEGNPDWSDAEIIEQRYGDFASSVYGAGAAVADVKEKYTGKALDNYLRRQMYRRPKLRPVRKSPLPYRSSTLTSAF